MIIIHIHNAVGGAVKSTVEIRVDVSGEVHVEKLTTAEIVEQEYEGPGDLIDHTGEIDDSGELNELANRHFASNWSEPEPKPDPDLWKDKQGLK